MPFTAGTLADGQLATSFAAIYSPTAPVIIESIHLYNTGTAVETVELGVTRSGSTRRQIKRFTLGPDESGVLERKILLSASDTLDAQTTTATTVDYLVTGAAS